MSKVFLLTKTQMTLLGKDKMSIFWFLAFPLLFVLLFGYVVPNVGNQHDLVILAEDNADKAIVDQLLTFPNATFDEKTSINEGLGQLQNGSISILISLNSETVDFHYLEEQTAWVQNIKNAILPSIGARNVVPHTYEGIHKIEPVDFILPGMIGLTIMQIGFFGGTSLLEDRSKQILRRLKLSGIRPWQIILSHIISRVFLVLLASLVLIAFGSLVLGVPLKFDLWYLQITFILLGGFTFLSLGLFIASILRSPEAGNIVAQTFNFLLAFICGIFLPLSLLPDSVQKIVSILPLTPLVEVLRTLFLGIDFEVVTLMTAGLIVLIWGGISFAVGSLLFKWE